MLLETLGLITVKQTNLCLTNHFFSSWFLTYIQVEYSPRSAKEYNAKAIWSGETNLDKNFPYRCFSFVSTCHYWSEISKEYHRKLGKKKKSRNWEMTFFRRFTFYEFLIYYISLLYSRFKKEVFSENRILCTILQQC